MRGQPRRAQVPTIDYRDHPPLNGRALVAAFVAGLTLGGAATAFALHDRIAPEAGAAVATPPGAAEPAGVLPARTGLSDSAVADGAALDAYRGHELKNALLRQSPVLRACYDTFLQDEPDISEGKVTIDFQIDPDGRVLPPGIVESELDAQSLTDCLVARIAGFEFPPPPGRHKTYAAHTFFFKKEARL
jgi:hypothetical protein